MGAICIIEVCAIGALDQLANGACRPPFFLPVPISIKYPMAENNENTQKKKTGYGNKKVNLYHGVSSDNGRRCGIVVSIPSSAVSIAEVAVRSDANWRILTRGFSASGVCGESGGFCGDVLRNGYCAGDSESWRGVIAIPRGADACRWVSRLKSTELRKEPKKSTVGCGAGGRALTVKVNTPALAACSTREMSAAVTIPGNGIADECLTTAPDLPRC